MGRTAVSMRGELGLRGSDQDHVSGVDCQVGSCLRVGEPSQLHDRSPSRVENDPFHVFDVALDEASVSGYEDYLRRGHGGRRLALARAHQSGCARRDRWCCQPREAALARRVSSSRLSARAAAEEPGLARVSRCYREEREQRCRP